LDDEVNNNLSGLVLNEINISGLSNMALSQADPLEMNSYKVTLAKNLIKKLLFSFIEK